MSFRCLFLSPFRHTLGLFCFHLYSYFNVLIWNPNVSVSKVRVQPWEHREDEVPKRGVLSDEEAGGVDVGVLQSGLLLGGDVLLLRAVPHFLQTGSGGQRDVCSRAIHGLVLQQAPLLFVQLRQNGHPGLVLSAWCWRVSSHVALTDSTQKSQHLRSPLNIRLLLRKEVWLSLQVPLAVLHIRRFAKGGRKKRQIRDTLSAVADNLL